MGVDFSDDEILGMKMECMVGDILHNNNGNDYRVMEKYSDSNMLLMQINTGAFVIGKGVGFFRKLPKPTEEELDKAKKLIFAHMRLGKSLGKRIAQMLPENSFVGKNQAKQTGKAGPDTANRLFNLIEMPF